MTTMTSWAVSRWPTDVFPNSPGAARHLIARNRSALVAAGVITRVGRAVVVDGQRWRAWMFKHGDRVLSYDTAGARAMRRRRDLERDLSGDSADDDSEVAAS